MKPFLNFPKTICINFVRLFTGFIIIPLLFITAQAASRSHNPNLIIQHRKIQLYPQYKMVPNGSFTVWAKEGSKWGRVGQLDFDRFLRTRTLRFTSPKTNGEIHLRLTKSAAGAVHIDFASLNHKPPYLLESDEQKKLLKADLDLLHIHKDTIELIFEPSNNRSEMLEFELTARIESEKLSNIPFQFPSVNTYQSIHQDSAFFKYRLDSNLGTLKLDGDLSRENLGTPLFAEQYPTASGHPMGMSYGWVRNDARNLYIALDFTPDNTLDGDKDYAKVFIKTDKGVKTFNIDARQTKWGVSGFTYTERVGYQHKVYEVGIPLKDIGVYPESNLKDPVEIAFALYGTASAGSSEPALAYDSNHNRYLLAYLYADTSSDIFGRLIDATGADIGSPFEITSTNNQYSPVSAISFSWKSNRYLVVWKDNASSGKIKGQLVDYDGSSYGSSFFIANSTGSKDNPELAYDSSNDRFLVAWQDFRNSGYDIYGQLVGVNGTLLDHNSDGTSDASSDNFAISTNSSSQTRPQVSFDNSNHRYLVIWEDYRNGSSNIMPYGQLINADGTLYDQDSDGYLEPDNTVNATDDSIQLSSVTGNASGGFEGHPDTSPMPDLAFDSTNHRFLAVWRDFVYSIIGLDPVTGKGTKLFGSRPKDIQGLAFDPDNNILYGSSYSGELLRITPGTSSIETIGNLGSGMDITGLAYDSSNDILYGMDSTNGNLVSINTFTGGATIIGSVGSYTLYSLAYDSSNDRLYSVDTSIKFDLAIVNRSTGAVDATIDTSLSGWFEGLTYHSSSGKLLVADYAGGAYPYRLYAIDPVTGSVTSVGEMGFDDMVGLAYDPNSYTLYGSNYAKEPDIYGQFISNNGSLYQTTAGNNFPVSATQPVQKSPVIVFDSGSSQYFGVWVVDDHYVNGSLYSNSDAIYGSSISTTGVLGSEASIDVNTGSTSGFVAAAANPYCGNVLTAYQDNTPTPPEIYLATIGTCSYHPMLTFPDSSTKGLISGSSAGDSFEFQIRYWGDSAPTQAELWIDLSGSSATTLPFGFSFPSPPRKGIFVALLISLILLMLLVFKSIQNQQSWAYLLPSLAILVLLAVIMIGPVSCSSSDDEAEKKTTGSYQVKTMSEVSSSDTDFSDGKLYNVSVQIDNAGTFKYKFVFASGGTTITGPTAEEQSLTVN